MNRPIGYWIKRLDAALEAHLDSTLARLKLSRRQWQAINTLAETPISPEELAEALRPFWGDNSALRERELAALVGRGLIILSDGYLTLSELGYAKHAEANRLVEDSRRELSAGIGFDEYEIALSVLERMSINAERLAR
ncbi:MarR family transcriptional regulator [Arthrobacter sp. ISL-30]|uniref:MarR family transcriptional regulator n=1 Tax=Arthrobacter sp. ISL-30 TaxID=2819109 RepID=UPI001BE985E7|nr:MarR family transcriptional regulator [Arthrobacter sp. ISL-30]MBT2514004.1 MarR family transcriptional regulator [Arthrobacter sp. ISL-30]